MRRILSLLVVALLAAPALMAQTPAPQAPPLDPVGNFQFQVLLPDGNVMGGRFSITGEKDKWQGTLASDAAPEVPMSGIGVSGQILSFSIVGPDGSALPLQLTFSGDDFSGQINFQGIVLMVSGKRVRAA